MVAVSGNGLEAPLLPPPRPRAIGPMSGASLRGRLRASTVSPEPELRSEEDPLAFSFPDLLRNTRDHFTAFGRRAFGRGWRKQWLGVAERLFPCLVWMKKYNANDARADVFSALTVAALLIPQGAPWGSLAFGSFGSTPLHWHSTPERASALSHSSTRSDNRFAPLLSPSRLSRLSCPS